MLFFLALRSIHRAAVSGRGQGFHYVRAAVASSLTMTVIAILDPRGLVEDLRTGDPLALLSEPPYK